MSRSSPAMVISLTGSAISPPPNRETRRALAVAPGDEIDAVPHEHGYEQAVFDLADHVLRASVRPGSR